MIINFTNHTSTNWGAEQLTAAHRWGDIIDIPFPKVPASADENYIAMLADVYCKKILNMSPNAVLVQGEMSLSFAVIERLYHKGITVLCASSERICKSIVTEEGSTIRKSIFKFVGFRKYHI